MTNPRQMAQKMLDTKAAERKARQKLDAEFPKVESWHELFTLAMIDERYQKLCIAGLENLGGQTTKDWKKAYQGLQDYIMAMIGEYGEPELDAENNVLEEVNFVRSCIDQVTLED